MSRASKRKSSERNSKILSSSDNDERQYQSIPGTPLQQMWHILNFHETRLTQLSQYLQEEASKDQNKGENKSETDQLIQYNTLLEQVQDLTERVHKLEAENENLSGNKLSLSIEEKFKKTQLEEPAV